MLRRTRWAVGPAVVFLGVLASCAPATRMVAEWKDDQYTGRPAKVFVVVPSVTTDDRGPRSLIEDEFVRQLKERGTDAVASTGAFPPDQKVGKDDITAKAKELGADAILVVKFLKKEAGDTHTPLQRYGVPQGFDASMSSYYMGSVSSVGIRDVSYDYNVISMETTLYDLATKQPLWQGLSQTTYQGGPLKQIKPYTSSVMGRLAHEKLVK